MKVRFEELINVLFILLFLILMAYKTIRGCGRGRDYGQERNSIPGINHSSNKKEKRKDEKREASRKIFNKY